MRPKHHNYLQHNQQGPSPPPTQPQQHHMITPIRDVPTAARILMKIEQSKHRHFSAPSKEISVFSPYPQDQQQPAIGKVLEIIKQKQTTGQGRQAQLQAQLKIVSIQNQKLINVIEHNHVNLPSVKQEIMLRQIQQLRQSCEMLEREREIQREQLSQVQTENERLLKLLLSKDYSSTTLNSNSAQSLPRGERLTLTLIKDQYQENIRLARNNFYDEIQHMSHNHEEHLNRLGRLIDQLERRIERAERELNGCRDTERSMGGELRQKQYENQQLTAKLVMYINELDDEREEKNQLRAEMEKLKKQLNTSLLQLQNRQPQPCPNCPLHHQRVSQLQTSNTKLYQQLSKIKDELLSLHHTHQSTVQTSNMRTNSLQNHIISLQNELQLKLQENSHLLSNIYTAQQELAEQTRQVNTAKADCHMLRQQIEHYQGELKEQQNNYTCLLQANELAQRQTLLKTKIRLAQHQQDHQLEQLCSQMTKILQKHETRALPLASD